MKNLKNYNYFERISCSILLCKNDEFSTIINANSSFYKLIEYTEKEMLELFNNRFSELVVDDLSSILKKINHAVDSKTVLDYEFRIKTKSGKIIWIHDIATYDSEYDIFNVVIMDITYKEHLLNHAYQLSEIDSLSKLLNRGALEKKINSLIDNFETKSQAMILIDLDNFKTINDSFGHQAGDEVIALFGQNLKIISTGQEVIGRLGGDEFLIYIPNVTSQSELIHYVEMINQWIKCELNNILIQSSIGVIFDQNKRYNFSDLYKFSDIALYNVKNSEQKGRYFLHSIC
ncbi:MAG: sensor domain-containing diguanylate cyclase [Cetobacterium sp.]